ncbi:MAG TPA: PAS domain-containing protein [Brevundimonas sp.]|jgi:PAS domain S-box-containing protein|uniref:PAS domain-containing hybrid sensor histidine kinase/response regulator n=1 Tax=Brevundimonas sp. TaxID=1871086 RepID=UPI002DF6966F|nr:PAS domain-containing protein [Brevundimonas sp.]
MGDARDRSPKQATTPSLNLDSPFDRLTALARAMFGTTHAMVGIVDGDRTLFRSNIGLGHKELPRETTVTDTMVELGPDAVLVVEDARENAATAAHPMVVGPPHLRFFAGVTITNAEGRAVGAIGVMDVEPRPAPDATQIENLRVLARMAGEIVDQADVVLRQNERIEQLRLAEEMAGIGQWRLDAATMAVTWSDEVYRIHGVERETFDPSYDDAIGFYHPDDRGPLMAAIQRGMTEGVGYRLTLRIIRADGEERRVEAHADCERAADGRVLSMYGVFRDVTEQEKLLHEAERNGRRYRLLADNTADVIARLKPDGSSPYISPAIEQLLGWRHEDMSGQSKDYVHPDDLGAVLSAGIEALRSGRPRSIQHRALHRDGREIWVESRFRAVTREDGGRPDEVIVSIRDASERKALEDRLQATLDESRRNEARYRLLADRATDVIITYGPDGNTRYYSPAVESMTGFKAEELVGRPVTTLMHPDDVPAMIAAFTEFRRSADARHQSRRYRVVTKAGEVRWLETRATVTRDDEGRAIEFQDVVRDVTATKRLEDELVEARDRAEAGARAKSEFLANMSHELRTPLTSVIGFAGLLKNSPDLPEQERRHVERIASASDSLLGVINDILDYSKLEAGRVEMEPMPFDLRSMVEAAAAMVEESASARGTTLTLELADDAPAWLSGDAGRLRQVTLNLLSNAAKFTTDGEIRLCAGWRNGRLRIEVRDTGIGIAEAKMAALFERFAQADASTTRLYGGTGLGLAISRRLIEMMGGEIGAESAPGRGSTFWFEVPAEEAEAPEAAPDVAHAPAMTMRILVADDAPANRELVSAILGGLGLTVDAVEDGAQAVEAARTGAYDLILMDVHMPVMDGLDATRAIRAGGGSAARTPIIALTANVQPEQAERCREAGMDAHVGKPIQIAELLRAMAEVTAEAAPAGLQSAG